MSVCTSCRAPIRWVETEQGKAMPIDRDPVPHGNLVLRGTGARTVAVVVVPLLQTFEERAAPHYVSHFVTCPNAAQHRRTR